jgi:cbb3-type cytochrome oxidase subunit 3
MFVGFILMGITGIYILGVVIYFFVKKRRKSALYASASLLPLALGVILMVPRCQ